MTIKFKYIAGKVKGRMMTKEEIKDRFDRKVAAGYKQVSSTALPFLPDYSYSFDLLTDFVGDNIPKGAKVLDLGAGTGNLTKALFEKNSSCSAVLLDFSDNMLDQAPFVLSKYKGRFAAVKADLFDSSLGNRKYDAVISSLAIHHGRGEKVYGKLYRNIYESLKPGGVFACCDAVEGGWKAVDKLCLEKWKTHLKKSFSDKDIKRIFANHAVEDSPISLRKHMELLAEAGFKNIDVLWKKCIFAVYTAQK